MSSPLSVTANAAMISIQMHLITAAEQAGASTARARNVVRAVLRRHETDAPSLDSLLQMRDEIVAEVRNAPDGAS